MNEESRTSEAIAADPATPPDVLVQLAQSDQPTITRAVAANPNTPLATLLKLAEQHATEFAHNPALPLHLLVNPHALATMPVVAAGQLLREPHLSPLLIAGLHHHDQAVVREAINVHVAVAGEAGAEWEMMWRAIFLTTQLQLDEDMSLQLLDKSHLTPYILPSLLDLLIEHPQITVANMVASYPFTPPAQLRLKLSSGAYLALNPNCPLDMLPWLAHTWEAKGAVVAHPKVTSAILTQIIGNERKSSKNGITQTEIARASHTPEALLMELATSDNKVTRAAVASNAMTPLPTAMQLLHDPSPVVHRAAMQYPRIPQHVIMQRWSLCNSDQMGDKERLALVISIAAHPNTPAAILATLAYHESEDVRRNVARNPSSPPSALEYLADDFHINYCVAQNPNTPTHVVARLAEEMGESRLSWVAQNPTTSFEKAYQLAQHGFHIGYAITGRTDITLDQRKQIVSLLLDQEIMTTSQDSSFFNHSNIIVGTILLSSPLVTAEVLAREVERPWHWLVRCAITYNPNVSTAVLHILANDGIRYVRAAARERLMEQEKAASSQI